MISFGKKIAILRKELGWSQSELAGKLNTSVSVISRYERDEMIPSIDAAKKLADLLQTTVGYLLGENEEANLFKDHEMLDRFKAIKSFKEEDKEKIYFTIDALIHEVANRKRYSHK
jgi:transcriptional regulator with XRE-family HTH domain